MVRYRAEAERDAVRYRLEMDQYRRRIQEQNRFAAAMKRAEKERLKHLTQQRKQHRLMQKQQREAERLALKSGGSRLKPVPPAPAGAGGPRQYVSHPSETLGSESDTVLPAVPPSTGLSLSSASAFAATHHHHPFQAGVAHAPVHQFPPWALQNQPTFQQPQPLNRPLGALLGVGSEGGSSASLPHSINPTLYALLQQAQHSKAAVAATQPPPSTSLELLAARLQQQRHEQEQQTLQEQKDRIRLELLQLQSLQQQRELQLQLQNSSILDLLRLQQQDTLRTGHLDGWLEGFLGSGSSRRGGPQSSSSEQASYAAAPASLGRESSSLLTSALLSGIGHETDLVRQLQQLRSATSLLAGLQREGPATAEAAAAPSGSGSAVLPSDAVALIRMLLRRQEQQEGEGEPQPPAEDER